MTDAIRMALSETGHVTVIAGTSSRLYQNTGKRTRDICGELGVDAVLEGTVQRGQGRVRVNVALVDGRTERHLRAVSSERESSNVLDLYADVARQVATGLDPAFSLLLIGWTAFWRAELAMAEEDAASSGTLWGFPPRTRQPYPIARRHARLGGTAQALAALEQACEQRDYIVVFLGTDPVFARLRHDARLQALVRRVGVPPAASR